MVISNHKNKDFVCHRFGSNQKLVGLYENCNFFMADLSKTRLLGTFVDCSFQGAIFSRAFFLSPSFIRCDFSVSSLDKVFMKSAEFDGCDFSNAGFFDVEGLVGCTFKTSCVGMDSIRGAKVLPNGEGTFKVYNAASFLETISSELKLLPPAPSAAEWSVDYNWRVDSFGSIKTPESVDTNPDVSRKEKQTPKTVPESVLKEVNKLPEIGHYRSSPHRKNKDMLSEEDMMTQAYAMAYGGSLYEDYEYESDNDWGFDSNAVLQCSNINIFRGIRARTA